MGRIAMMFWVIAVIAVVALGYVRLAPSSPMRWHRMPEIVADETGPGYVKRIVQTGPEGLYRIHRFATASDRTEVLAGSVQEGMITYITRSKVFAFPDYTTVKQVGDTVHIYARLRFGRSDFRVNAERVKLWIGAAQAGG